MVGARAGRWGTLILIDYTCPPAGGTSTGSGT